MPDRGPPSDPSWVSLRTAALDRYVVLSRLGQGGDGVVWRAWDPELDRQVAIKVLRRRGRTADSRLLHEARVVAKLRHPNIVQIHDVGRDDADGEAYAGVFFVMEYLADGDMTAWLGRARRGWREILRMYAAVARGLAAAHAVGLVHRDVKPHNVLVGADGRPRVVDFGLAQARDAGTGGTCVAGTVPYMAPEQQRGEVPDARADQYALGVSLYEALAGRRPFLGNPGVLLRCKESGTYPRPGGVPRRVVATIARALAPDPSQRFDDMTALADALDSTARRSPAAAWWLGATAAMAGAIGVHQVHADDPCPAPERSPATVWAQHRDPASRGGEAAARIDAGAVAWDRAWRDACERARIDIEVSPAVYEAQTRCLVHQTEAIGAALDELDHQREAAMPMSSEVEWVALAASIEPVVRCDVDAIAALDPEAAARWGPAQGWQHLARARVLHELGREADTLAVLRGAWNTVGVADAPLLRARLHATAAAAHAGLGEFERAKREAFEALWAAEPIRDRATAAAAWLELAWIEGVEREGPKAAQWFAFATSAVERAGDDPWLRAELHHLRGGVHYRAGDFAAAEASYRAALTAQRALVGDSHPWTARTLNHLGNALFEAGRLPDAIAASSEALAIRRRILVPGHPLIAAALDNLAGMHLSRGELDTAAALIDESVALLEGQGGPHELYARVIQGRIAEARGHDDAAAAGYRAALGVRMASIERDHRAVRQATDALAALDRADPTANRGDALTP